jgi:hypothetical protein
MSLHDSKKDRMRLTPSPASTAERPPLLVIRSSTLLSLVSLVTPRFEAEKITDDGRYIAGGISTRAVAWRPGRCQPVRQLTYVAYAQDARTVSGMESSNEHIVRHEVVRMIKTGVWVLVEEVY